MGPRRRRTGSPGIGGGPGPSRVTGATDSDRRMLVRERPFGRDALPDDVSTPTTRIDPDGPER